MIRIHKRYWTFLAALIIATIFNLFPPQQLNKLSPTPSPTKSKTINPESVLVTEVIDGDTIVLENNNHVRLIGIDSPELHHPKKPVQCFGREAKDRLAELILGRKVRLEKDVSEADRYKRLLRYVYIDKVFINDYLVRQGYAVVSTFPPDVKYVDQFRQAQEEARNNNRGLWEKCIQH